MFVTATSGTQGVNEQMIVYLKIRPEKIPSGRRIPDAEDERPVVGFSSERVNQAVPENRHAAVIPADVTLVLRMVDSVIRRRYQNSIEHPRTSHNLCLHPELISQTARIGDQHYLERETDDKQRRLRYPPATKPRS